MVFFAGNGLDPRFIEIIKKIKCPTYIDIGSGLKGILPVNDNLIPSLDHPEVRLYLEKKRPDLIIVLGNYFVSKHLQNLKGDGHDTKVFYISDNINPQKIYTQQPSYIIPTNFLEKVDFHLLTAWTLKEKFLDLNVKKRNIIDKYGLTFPFISKTYSDIGNKSNSLYIGNSTAVS